MSQTLGGICYGMSGRICEKKLGIGIGIGIGNVTARVKATVIITKMQYSPLGDGKRSLA